MANSYFSFKQFTIFQDKSAFKVGTDGVLMGATANIGTSSKILDVGAGTGLITIMLAQRSNAEIIAVEPDYESFMQCCENVRLCKWSSRIRVEHTDLQTYDAGDMKFDLIVSNPPYFTDSFRNPDERKSAARHNDLLNSDDLLLGALRLMSDTGQLQIIMPYVEGNVFIAEASKYNLFCNSILKIRPTANSETRRLILTFSRHMLKVAEKFLTIEKGKRHEFTEEYMNLTKDFYLKF